MHLKVRKIFCMLLFSIFFLSTLIISIPIVLVTQETFVRTVPQKIVLGSPTLENIVGREFTVAVVIGNVKNLYAFSIQFGWNKTYLDHVNHTVTVPIEDYPTPILPSPYPGILHHPISILRNETYSDWYWVECNCLAPPPPFSGNGTVFLMTFRVKYQPYLHELPAGIDHVNLTLSFISTNLNDPEPKPIPNTPENGIVKLYARKTRLYVNPSTITAPLASTFTINVNIANVERLSGFWFRLGWNATILDLLKINLFPPWTNYFVAVNKTGVDPETELDYWEIGVGTLAGAVPFNGNTTLARLIFKAIARGNSTLDLYNPRLSDPAPAPIPHEVYDGYVEVTKIPSDINDDDIVDILDVIIWAVAFGSQPEDPNWNPDVDLFHDNIIDIFDGIAIATNFGKTIP